MNYTDADVQACKQPILDNFHPPTDRVSSWHIRPEEMARAILDEVAPAIAARAAAKALRDAAWAIPGFDGIRTHGDAARWLRDRAAEIGAQS